MWEELTRTDEEWGWEITVISNDVINQSGTTETNGEHSRMCTQSGKIGKVNIFDMVPICGNRYKRHSPSMSGESEALKMAGMSIARESFGEEI